MPRFQRPGSVRDAAGDVDALMSGGVRGAYVGTCLVRPPGSLSNRWQPSYGRVNQWKRVGVREPAPGPSGLTGGRAYRTVRAWYELAVT